MTFLYRIHQRCCCLPSSFIHHRLYFICILFFSGGSCLLYSSERGEGKKRSFETFGCDGTSISGFKITLHPEYDVLDEFIHLWNSHARRSDHSYCLPCEYKRRGKGL